jgi:hypothetical protein
MKRKPWIAVLLIGAAMLAIVPTTLAVGEPGTTLYAPLGANRFPAGTGAQALAKLRFVSDQSIVLDVTITATEAKLWTARVYSRGSCAQVLNWVANKGAGDPAGYLDVMSNGGEKSFQLTQRDVNRVRAALARGEGLALMIAGTNVQGATYRTCTGFTATVPPITTLPPITTSTTPATTRATTTGATTTGSTTTGATTTQVTTTPPIVTTATTSTVTTTTATSQTTSTTTGFPNDILCFTITFTGDLPFTPTLTLPNTSTTTTSTSTSTSTSTNTTSTITTTNTSVSTTAFCFPANI